MPSPSSAHPFSISSAQALAFSAQKSTPTMSGSGAGGKWMASSIKKEDIKKLREARYLAKEIAHRLQAKGLIVPTPEP